MIKAIFWDNDGVLVDTERLYFRATQETLDAAGVLLDHEQYVEFFLRQGRGAWHLLEERGQPLKRSPNGVSAGTICTASSSSRKPVRLTAWPGRSRFCTAATSWASSRARGRITSISSTQSATCCSTS